MSFDNVLDELYDNVFCSRGSQVVDYHIVTRGASLLDWIMQKNCKRSDEVDWRHLDLILEIIRRYNILQKPRYPYEDIMNKYNACISFNGGCFHHYIKCNIPVMYSVNKADMPSRETLIMSKLPPRDRKEYLCTNRQRKYRMIWTVEICVSSPYHTKIIYDIFDYQISESIVF